MSLSVQGKCCDTPSCASILGGCASAKAGVGSVVQSVPRGPGKTCRARATEVPAHTLSRQIGRSTTWRVLPLYNDVPWAQRVSENCAKSTRLVVLSPLPSLWPKQQLSLHCPHFSPVTLHLPFIQLHRIPQCHVMTISALPYLLPKFDFSSFSLCASARRGEFTVWLAKWLKYILRCLFFHAGKMAFWQVFCVVFFHLPFSVSSPCDCLRRLPFPWSEECFTFGWLTRSECCTSGSHLHTARPINVEWW